MSELSNFDQFTKNKLADYSPDVPTHIWKNIMAEKRKKKPIPFFFQFFNNKNILLIASLLLLSFAGIVIYNKTQTSSQVITSLNKQPVESNKTIRTEKIAATTTLNNKQSQLQHITENSATGKNIDNDKTTETDKVIRADLNKRPHSKNKKITVSNNAIFYSSADEHIAKKIGSRKGKAPDFKVDNADLAANENVNNLNILDKAKQSDAIDKLMLLKMLYHPEKDKTGFTLQNIVSSNIFLPPCPEIEKNAAGNKDYIEAYFGPDYAYKSYKSFNAATDSSGNSALLQRRKDALSYQSAFSAGFRYTRVFSNGVSVRTGINYSQINEKFSYVQSNVVQVTYIIDANTGDTTGSYISNGTRYKTTYNHYRTFDVPLLFGFETGNGNVHFNLNAGVIINIYSWQKGESLDSTLHPVSITTGKGDPAYQYKTNIGAGFITAASIYYKLNDRFHLLAEPYWRYNFAPMSKETISLQEKFSTIGLRLGIRMDLRY